MGYTHYYDVNGWRSAEWQAAWPNLIRDVPLILEASDVLICGPCNEDEDEDLASPVISVNEGICFNGVANDGHETFVLSRKEHHEFCKTLQKPYDVGVACVLLRAYALAPSCVRICSDGSWDSLWWVKARQLYQELWPGELISCPWNERDGEVESNHDSANGETLATIPNANEGPLALVIPRAHLEITDTLEAIGLDSASSLLLGSNEPTVSRVDFGPIREWLSLCDKDVGHESCKASPIQWQYLPGTRFKLIDLHRRCIVEAPEGCSFFALSYVWGGVDQLRLTTATAPLLMRDGGLDVAWPRVPTTIRDAIFVCEQLGEQYLWVDALCIIQDTAQDMKLQILRMRQIYSAAKCTITAVSAETADFGLLGSPLAKDFQSWQVCKSEESLNTVLDFSPWSSRAWCYQEKVLSHRLMLFTSNGIYMQCQQDTYDANGIQLQSERTQEMVKFNTVGGMLSISPGEDLESFVSAVEYYSQRNLTKQEDKMNAFQGIFRRYGGRMDGMKFSFCYGLPTCAFDQIICWRSYQHNPHLRNQAFPSWSWLGWNDRVSFDREMLKEARTSHMIYRPDRHNDGVLDADVPRKPASQFFNEFGFPASGGGMFYNSPERHLDGSVTDLCIAMHPMESTGSNSRYAVFPSRCSQQPPPTPPEMISLWDLLSRPMPKIEWMDAETAAAPSIPSPRQTEKEQDFAEHEQHDDCEAQTPFGYIWLDRKWREQRPRSCAMQFLALTGKKDPDRQGKSIITMLMCLQRMEKNGHFWARERVQVMDCEIAEERWLRAGATSINVKLT